ncbi:Glu/Leu/Phe/Val dehydrogenase dimerization domain-containing protein [Sorangium sp. So ce1153]|uniref:Glu/Leu/Phe/Val dehydrogenase dimerization domain-containing protein n=1 Tax=Sorangium sp. So ce1153 TaxID=3133333 RepID=UPI003F637F17
MKSVFDTLAAMGHEQVLFCADEPAGYRAIIAVHSTALGPALGGTRLLRYASDEGALVDALRLSRGMTYKNALAGMDVGGGKAVILRSGAEPLDRARLFRAHGRFIERLGGRFITGEDVGTTPADMELIRRETRHVKGLAGEGGDPSPWTARGVLRAIQAAARHRWGSDDLAGRTVALQGCGSVGSRLAAELHRTGARLIVADVEAERARHVAAELGASVAPPDEIASIQADIFAPCALGGVFDDRAVQALRAEIVAGAANNQLLEPRHGDALAARGVLYVPDVVANAGGVLSGGADLFGWPRAEVERRVHAIYDTVLRVLDMAKVDGAPPHLAAERLAEQRLRERAAAG